MSSSIRGGTGHGGFFGTLVHLKRPVTVKVDKNILQAPEVVKPVVPPGQHARPQGERPGPREDGDSGGFAPRGARGRLAEGQAGEEPIRESGRKVTEEDPV